MVDDQPFQHSFKACRGHHRKHDVYGYVLGAFMNSGGQEALVTTSIFMVAVPLGQEMHEKPG